MKTTEHDEQVALFKWANLMSSRHPELHLMFAIPNGGHRNKVTAAKMKAEGVKPGVPDILLPVSRHGCNGLFIEMKAPDLKPKNAGKGGLSEAQLAWVSDLIYEDYDVKICYGFEEAKKAIETYLGI